MTHKQIIEQTLEFWLYQVKNGKCTTEELKSICDNTINNIDTQATIQDIADFYKQSESNVRNVLSRKYIPKDQRPKRKVLYNFKFFQSIIPSKWIS